MKGHRKPVKANALSVKALKPEAKKYEVSVAGHPGLVIRVWPSGEKTYLLRYKLDGVLKRVALGAGNLAQAIAEWAADRAVLKRGDDAGEIRKAARDEKRAVRARDRSEPTVAGVIERYLKEHVRPKLKTAGEVERILRKNVPKPFADRKVKDVTKAEVKALVNEIATTGNRGKPSPIMANRTLAVLSSMFSFAADVELIPANPLLGMKRPAAESPRDRVLSPEEIRALWQWTGDDTLPQEIRMAIRFHLLTGARASEVLAARWIEIKGNVWEIPAPRSKSGKARQVPLSDEALAVLAPLSHDGTFVFPAPGIQGHVRLDTYVHTINEVQVAAARAEAGLDEDAPPHALLEVERRAAKQAWRSHDLRRTAATGMAELGAPREVIALVLGHTIPGVTSRYDRGERLSDKRRALVAWGHHVVSVATVKPPVSLQLVPGRSSAVAAS